MQTGRLRGWSGVVLFAAASAVCGQTAVPAAPSAGESRLFAVEIKVGPRWDGAKPTNEQTYFREHSANLRKLRDAGHLVLGARYADKGLLVLAAPTAEEARAMMDADPAIGHGTFAYEVHELRVFYPGTVPARTVR